MSADPRTLEKGKPRFGKWPNEKLDRHIAMMQDLLFAYETRDGFKFEHDVLNKIWKDMSDHQSDRLAAMPGSQCGAGESPPAARAGVKKAKPKFRAKGK